MATAQMIEGERAPSKWFARAVEKYWPLLADPSMTAEQVDAAIRRFALDTWSSPSQVRVALSRLGVAYHDCIDPSAQSQWTNEDLFWYLTPEAAERIHAFDGVTRIDDATCDRWLAQALAALQASVPRHPIFERQGAGLGDLAERTAYRNLLSTAAGHFRKSDECYLRQDGDLGPYIRWVLALRLVDEQWHRIRSELDKLPNAPGRTAPLELLRARLEHVNRRLVEGQDPFFAAGFEPLEVDSHEFVRAFHYAAGKHATSAAFYRSPSSWGQALLAAMTLLRRSNKVQSMLTLGDFLDQPVMGKGDRLGDGAYRRFRNWLEFGWMPARDDLSLLRSSSFLMTRRDGRPSERSEQLQFVLRALQENDKQNLPGDYALSGNLPVLNIWSPCNWHGTQAFVTRLAIELNALRRSGREALSIVYIPLSRALTVARTMRSRDDITSTLRRALGISNGDVEEETGDDLSRLRDVRRELTQRRTLVVFDGVELSSDPFSRLFDVIKHTDWVTYLRAIVQPDLEAMLETGRDYQSRFLVLSARRIDDLRPWMPGEPVPLSGVPDHQDAIDLLLRPRPHAAHEAAAAALAPYGHLDADETAQECLSHWPRATTQAASSGPIVKDEDMSLCALYDLSDLTLERIHRLPNELDLTLLWCAQETGHAGSIAIDAHTPDLPPERRLAILREFLASRSRTHPAECVGLQLIALSLSGLRLTTLRRCARTYAGLVAASDACLGDALLRFAGQLESDSGVTEFLSRYRPMLVIGQEEELSRVKPWQRWFDMQAFQDPVESRVASERRHLIDLRLLELRELLCADVMDASPRNAEGEDQRRAHFERLSLVLGEESLTQATAQLRRLPPGSDMNIYTLRRLLQAAYHGLMSCSFMDGRDLGTTPALPPDVAGIPGFNLPASREKRYAYLYEFLFRKSIENAPQWKVSRGLARHDVRLCLLAMFLSPGWARRVLASLYKRDADHRMFEHFGAFVPHHDFRNPFDPRAPHLRGAIGSDLFRAFLHCALRTGRAEYVAKQAVPIGDALSRRMIAAASTVPGEETLSDATAHLVDMAMGAMQAVRALHGHAALVPALRQEEHERFAFAKLSIDAKQRLEGLGDAVNEECAWWLRRFGASDVTGLLDLGAGFDVATFDKSGFETDRLLPLLATIQREVQLAESLLCLSDVMARYAEARVTKAEAILRRTGSEDVVRAYASAYALYFLSDRLRSSAAMLARSTPNWPAVSSRASRFYVRCALKIAKEAAEAGRRCSANGLAQQSTLFANAHAFFAHARGRIDVQTRHLWQLPAERATVQLLLVSAARVWGTICECEERLDEAKDSYQASLWYATQAETVLEGLGVPDSLATRLHFERAKTLTKLAAQAQDPASAFATNAARELAVVARLSRGRPRWKERLNNLRQEAAWTAGIEFIETAEPRPDGLPPARASG